MAANKADKPNAQSAEKSSAGKSVDEPVTKASSAVGMFALLIAFVALAAAAWLALQQQALQDLPGRIGADSGKLSVLDQRLEMLTDTLAAQQQSVVKLLEFQKTSEKTVADLPLRIEQLEKRLADIPGVSARSKAEWLKAEALYYLRIANAQVLLAGNSEVATSALILADEKLRDSGDPRLVPVRALLSNEIAALQALPKIDRAGVAFKLQSLAQQVDNWPFRESTPDSFSPSFAAPANELGPWDRLLITIKSVFDSIVTVKQTDELAPAQLGASEQSLISESMKAELQVARLAFVSTNTELFAQSLTNAKSLINAYFDSDATSVKAAVKTLTDLQAIQSPGAAPDISGSLALMMSISANSEAQ